MTDIYLNCPTCKRFELSVLVYVDTDGTIREFTCSSCSNHFRDGKVMA